MGLVTPGTHAPALSHLTWLWVHVDVDVDGAHRMLVQPRKQSNALGLAHGVACVP